MVLFQSSAMGIVNTAEPQDRTHEAFDCADTQMLYRDILYFMIYKVSEKHRDMCLDISPLPFSHPFEKRGNFKFCQYEPRFRHISLDKSTNQNHNDWPK